MILFYSYSHKDEGLRDELEAHLSILKRQGVLESWHDRKIPPGSDWREAIAAHLDAADLILFLISADFLASDYCSGWEVELALRRYRSRSVTVVPVILRACLWQQVSPFADLQPLPKDGKPITSWTNRDEAWTDVVQGIRRALDEKATTTVRPSPILPRASILASAAPEVSQPGSLDAASRVGSRQPATDAPASLLGEELPNTWWGRLWPAWFGSVSMISFQVLMLMRYQWFWDFLKHAPLAGIFLGPVILGASFACGCLFSANPRLTRVLRFLGGVSVPILFRLMVYLPP